MFFIVLLLYCLIFNIVCTPQNSLNKTSQRGIKLKLKYDNYAKKNEIYICY